MPPTAPWDSGQLTAAIYHGRVRRKLAPNRVRSLVRRKRRRMSSGRESADNLSHLTIRDLGDSEKLLLQNYYFRKTAARLLNRGIVPTESGWNGWLGYYEKSLAQMAWELQAEKAKSRTRKSRSENANSSQMK